MITIDNALLAGYDFMEDAVRYAASELQSNGGVTVTQLLGRQTLWRADDLKNALTQSMPDLALLSVHAQHFNLGTPTDEPWLRAAALLRTPTPSQASLVYAIACHAGLNVPGLTHLESVDFPEVWAGWGATAIGATGWAYGGRFERAYLEELLGRFTANLAESDSIGDALVQAKQGYYQEHTLNAFHKQTLATTTLYGLPMLVVKFPTPIAAHASQAPISTQLVTTNQPHMINSNGVAILTSTITLPVDWLVPMTTTVDNHYVGNYYAYQQNRPAAEQGRPVVPFLSQPLGLTLQKSLSAHGVFWLGGDYREITNFNPVIEAASVLTPSTQLLEPTYNRDKWWPTQPVRFSRLETTNTTRGLWVGTAVDAQVVGYLAQFRGNADSGVLRLYQSFTYQTFYSDSIDVTPPTIQAISITTSSVGVTVTAQLAESRATIYQVIALYTTGDGHWNYQSLNYDQAWQGLLPATATEILVQAADSAGNVTFASQSEQESDKREVYLPLITR